MGPSCSSLESRGNSAVLTYASIPDSKLVPPAWDQDSRVTLKPWEKLVTSGLYPGEGDGNPRQNSCLGNPMDRGALWAPKTPKRSQRVRHNWWLSTAQWIERDSFKSFFQDIKKKKTWSFSLWWAFRNTSTSASLLLFGMFRSTFYLDPPNNSSSRATEAPRTVFWVEMEN